jgi:hypothetical protein
MGESTSAIVRTEETYGKECLESEEMRQCIHLSHTAFKITVLYSEDITERQFSI